MRPQGTIRQGFMSERLSQKIASLSQSLAYKQVYTNKPTDSDRSLACSSHRELKIFASCQENSYLWQLCMTHRCSKIAFRLVFHPLDIKQVRFGHRSDDIRPKINDRKACKIYPSFSDTSIASNWTLTPFALFPFWTIIHGTFSFCYLKI